MATTAEHLRHLNKSEGQVGRTPRTLVWTKNKVRLYRYEYAASIPPKETTPLLIVHSLITKPYIFDLIPQRSFIAYLLTQGIDVYLLDWGSPGPEDRRLRFDDLVMDYLSQAVQQVIQISGKKCLNLLGYCIGGILAILYTATHPETPPSSLILFATPLDFSASSLLTNWLNPRYYNVDRLVETFGNIPPAFLNWGSRLLLLAGWPLVLEEIWENADDKLFLASLGAIHRWGVDNEPFPGEAFRQLIKDFYQSNKLINDRFVLAGQQVSLSKIITPILAIAARADYLVPPLQIIPALDKVSSTEKELIVAPCGHIGLVTIQKVITILWPRVVDWLARHSHV